MVVPNPDLPTFLGDRFVATAYRTTRALLICRHLLDHGSSFQELPADTVTRVVPIDPTSVLRGAAELLAGLPTLPQDYSSPSEIERLATVHGFVAVQLGLDPQDPILHWFEPERFQEFFPEWGHMMTFEAHLLKNVGRTLVHHGRERAFRRLERVFGEASVYERKDWAALPSCYLQEFASNSTEIDRKLMVARLEGIASRARKAMDNRLEAQCARAIASVQGLTFLDDDKKKKELYMLLNKPPERSEANATLPPLPERPRLPA